MPARELSIHSEQSESRDSIPVTQHKADAKTKLFRLDSEIQTSKSKKVPAKLLHFTTNSCKPVESFIQTL